MEHLPELVKHLALILLVASVVTIIFKKLKQPVVLGYILAGFLISQYFLPAPTEIDQENITTWAEIGVIFLLFALGLEFSFKKLFSLGAPVFIGSAVNFLTMIPVGYLVGQIMGWTTMESVFLGCMISMSSTTIIIKAFDELGLKKKRFAKLVFGLLIVEDLVAILMMVLLSTIAVSRGFEGTELLMEVLKLVFFIAIWLIVGIYIFPTLLEKIKKVLNDETLLVLSVGLCLGMVLFANAVGFSTVLGAFIMGSILSETTQLKRIEHLLEPLKNLFGAVFFVSVGMMIEPSAITTNWLVIIKLTAIVICGRVLFASTGMVVAGENLKTSMQAGFSLAQIGEFSFIIATVGMQLKVIDPFLYPIIVAVSVITSFLTPYMIKGSASIYNKVEKIVPKRWNKIIMGSSTNKITSTDEENEWKKYRKASFYSIAVYSLISVAILLVARLFLFELIINNIEGVLGIILYSAITIIAMSPFINAIMNSGLDTTNLTKKYDRSSRESDIKKKWNAFSSKHRFGAVCIITIKHLIPLGIITYILQPFFIDNILMLFAVSLAITFVIRSFARRLIPKTKKMEEQFKYNLSDNTDQDKTITKEIKEELQKQSIHIEKIEVPVNYANIGKTLGELNFRSATGVSIVSIIRGNKIINIPDRHTHLFPFDKVIIVGSDEEVQNFANMLEKNDVKESATIDVNKYRVELFQYELQAENPIIGKTIRSLDVQNKTDCLITSIERNDNMLVKFSADFELKQNDILWIAGEKEKVLNFEKSLLDTKKHFAY
ncbi:MAG: cation:proton antiporter [Bacteroidetes bacterium]|nr:cation:proton antiporter [Bacteroidota bacterium]